MDQPLPQLTPPAPGCLFRSELPTPLSPVSSRVSLPLRSWPPLLAGPQCVHVPRSVSPNPSQSRTTRHRPTPALRPQGPAGSLHTPRPTRDMWSELILLPHPPPHSLTHMLSHTCTHTHTLTHMLTHSHAPRLTPTRLHTQPTLTHVLAHSGSHKHTLRLFHTLSYTQTHLRLLHMHTHLHTLI